MRRVLVLGVMGSAGSTLSRQRRWSTFFFFMPKMKLFWLSCSKNLSKIVVNAIFFL